MVVNHMVEFPEMWPDDLSWHHLAKHEWHLHVKVVQSSFALWCTILVDLFATHENKHCCSFCAL